MGRKSKKGLFITFEGAESVGKSTQIKELKKYLESLGRQVLVTREPGGTPIGEQLRSLHKSTHMTGLTELFVVLASRAQHVSEVILPALKQDKVVICDRFQESTFVYQAMIHKLDLKMVRKLNHVATQGLQPDFIAWIDLSAKEIEKRMKARRGNQDRFDQAGLDFHKKVISGYRKLAKAQKRPKLHQFDGNLPEVELAKQISKKLKKLLNA